MILNYIWISCFLFDNTLIFLHSQITIILEKNEKEKYILAKSVDLHIDILQDNFLQNFVPDYFP